MAAVPIDVITMMDIAETITSAEVADLMLKLFKCAIDSDCQTAKSEIATYNNVAQSRKKIKQFTVTAQASGDIARRKREKELADIKLSQEAEKAAQHQKAMRQKALIEAVEQRKSAKIAASEKKEREKRDIKDAVVKPNGDSYDEFVYIVKCNDAFKIGVTNNIKKRMAGLQVGSPYKLELIHSLCCNNSYEIESRLHDMYKDKNISGEWFELENEDLEYIKNVV